MRTLALLGLLTVGTALSGCCADVYPAAYYRPSGYGYGYGYSDSYGTYPRPYSQIVVSPPPYAMAPRVVAPRVYLPLPHPPHLHVRWR